MIKNILVLLCLLILQSSIYNVAASGDDIIINNNIYTNGGGNGDMREIHSDISRDVAAAVATAASMSFCNFDYSPGLQGCVGTATYDEEWALNFQVGKRVDTLLLTGGFACDDEFNECAAGGAVSFRF